MNDLLIEFNWRLAEVETQLADLQTADTTLVGAFGGAIIGAVIAGTATYAIYKQQNKHFVAIYELRKLEDFLLNLKKLVAELNDFSGRIEINLEKFEEIILNTPNWGTCFAIPISLKFEEKYNIPVQKLYQATATYISFCQNAFQNSGNNLTINERKKTIQRSRHDYLDTLAEVENSISAAMDTLERKL